VENKIKPTVCPICGVKGRIASSPAWGNMRICQACKGVFFHGPNIIPPVKESCHAT